MLALQCFFILLGFRLKDSDTNATDIDKVLLSTLGSKSSNKTGTQGLFHGYAFSVIM